MHIKLLKIQDKRNPENFKLMVQIRDVSDRLLKQEMTAQKNVLTLINATVSHELRNPLHSMIGQITGMEKYLQKLNKLANLLGSSENLSSS